MSEFDKLNLHNGKTLRAFHGDPEIKEKLLGRILGHQKKDNIIQGQYWENGKGCAVGCSLHPIGTFDIRNFDNYKNGIHGAYPEELGIPEWLARLEDKIFEGLTPEQAKDWPLDFIQAIPVGASFDGLQEKLSIHRLEECLKLKKTWGKRYRKKVVKAIKKTIKALESGLKDDLEAAESSARSAAESAARSAAESAAGSAASAARSAASAARSAALSAVPASWSAALSAGAAGDAAEFAAEATMSAAYAEEAAFLLQ